MQIHDENLCGICSLYTCESRCQRAEANQQRGSGPWSWCNKQLKKTFSAVFSFYAMHADVIVNHMYIIQ